MRKKIFSVTYERKHVLLRLCGLKIRRKYGVNKNAVKNFIQHEIAENTVLLIELNECHKETLPGYYKYFRDLGFNVEFLVCGDSDGVFSRLNDDIKVWEMHFADLRYILKTFDFSKYKRIVFNSRIIYTPKEVDLKRVIRHIPEAQEPNIYVQHHIDKMFKYPNYIILANPGKVAEQDKLVVNPHYFGRINITPKNEITNFISVGELSKKRRNTALLLDAVSKLIANGVEDFKITVVGHGNIADIPENIKPFFDIKGRVSYDSMYDLIERADYFLMLLDPEIEAHKRYLKGGTSGSFQLVYGFLKPCIINQIFAETYGLSKDDSFIYRENTELCKAMNDAINLDSDAYSIMQNNLEHKADGIQEISYNNLRSMLSIKEVNKHISV